MAQNTTANRTGIYNVEYFSGAQAAVYIGDVWVDEVTSISYAVQQTRTPLYGYADTYFRDVSEGQVIVQGSFTVNFKEAGYLWLVLDNYRKKIKGMNSLLTPFLSSATTLQQNVERAFNSLLTRAEKVKLYKDLAEQAAKLTNRMQSSKGVIKYGLKHDISRTLVQEKIALGGGSASASLGGFASDIRARGGIGAAEDAFETFEDMAWSTPQVQLDNETRRADDPRLNPFDIYVTFGDYAGDNTANHTVQKLSDVHILSTQKQVVIDGQPIQEVYQFIARNLV